MPCGSASSHLYHVASIPIEPALCQVPSIPREPVLYAVWILQAQRLCGEENQIHYPCDNKQILVEITRNSHLLEIQRLC
jgi:hypothetical protein